MRAILITFLGTAAVVTALGLLYAWRVGVI